MYVGILNCQSTAVLLYNSSSQISEITMCSGSSSRRGRKKKASNRLCVDQVMSDDDSVVLLPLETMQRLHLSHADPVWIKGKKGRQSFSIAIAYDDTCDIEPKIRLNKVVMNELVVNIGGFVSVHRPLHAEKRERILSKDDNLKLSEFLNNVSDGILSEILLRLPNSLSSLQYSSVCKRWYSIISDFAFIRNFIHIHDHLGPRFSDNYYDSRPFKLLFVRFDRGFYYAGEEDDYKYFRPFSQVFSEKSEVPHGEMLASCFDFLPCHVTILASFDDLVMATNVDRAFVEGARENYICNPLTKQWLALPEVVPPFNISGYGLIREPISCNKQLGCTTNARFRVVLIGSALSDSDFDNVRHFMDNEFVTQVFCSETGQWSEYVISHPLPQVWPYMRKREIVVVASNGTLYWIEGSPIIGIVAFDPFNDTCTKQCGFIRLPIICFKSTFWSTEGKVCLGVVNGRLRLSQLYETQTYFAFKVWELKNHDSEFPSWVLVYNLKLNSSERTMYLLSFHPNNANVVFLLCGNDICRYEIYEKKYEKVGEYPDKVNDPSYDISTLTLVYPSWPTVLALSSS